MLKSINKTVYAFAALVISSLLLSSSTQAECVQMGHYFERDGNFYHAYTYRTARFEHSYRPYYQFEGGSFKDSNCLEAIEIRNAPNVQDNQGELDDSAEFKDLIHIAQETIYPETVCFYTAFEIQLRLTKKHNYRAIKNDDDDALYLNLISAIEKTLALNEHGFIWVMAAGHSYWLEVHGEKKYLRLLTSFGGRYTLEQWITSAPLKQASTDLYLYDLVKAEKAKALFGTVQIKDEYVQEFLQRLLDLGSAANHQEFDEALENIFGVKFPSSDEIPLETLKSGSFILYQK